MRQGEYFQTSSFFFKKKKTLYEVIASFFSLVSIFFDSPQFDIQ